MDIIVIGGGCFGTTQTGRLLTAMSRGVVKEARIVVVDRNFNTRARDKFGGDPNVTFVKSDWYDYLGAYFSNPAHGGDRIVPAHIAPHLLFQVAVSNVAIRTGRRVDMESVNGTFDLPFDKAGEGGIRYISAAAWLCPFACIEPEICPAIRGSRDWDLSRIVPEVMKQETDMSVVFKTTHFAWGVGTIGCGDISSSYDSIVRLAESNPGRSLHIAIATTSNCHGVVGQLKIS